MKIRRLQFFLIFSFLSAFLFSISACGDATPPIAGPNLHDDGLEADPPTATIPGDASEPAEDDGDSDDGDGVEGSVGFEPDIVVSAAAGAFAGGETVLVGVELEDDFDGVSPQVGPLDPASLADLSEEIEIAAENDGSLQFGVYLDTTTTPGIYTIFAEGASDRYQVEVDVVESTL